MWSCDQHYINIFSFPCTVLKAYIQNLIKKVKWFLRNTSFNFDMKMTLGEEINLTLNTHNNLSTYLVVCINLCSGRRLQ